jgi:hypothetical protein
LRVEVGYTSETLIIQMIIMYIGQNNRKKCHI